MIKKAIVLFLLVNSLVTGSIGYAVPGNTPHRHKTEIENEQKEVESYKEVRNDETDTHGNKEGDEAIQYNERVTHKNETHVDISDEFQ